MDAKKILIINGSGGVGKGEFVKTLSNITSTYQVSIVDRVKAIARSAGWNGKKDEKSRKFLYDLKRCIDEYNDSNYMAMQELMDKFIKTGKINGQPYNILCIDMREPDQIERAKQEYGAKAVLVTNAKVAQILSNGADASVYDCIYDYIVVNDGSLEELQSSAEVLHEELFKVDNNLND